MVILNRFVLKNLYIHLLICVVVFTKCSNEQKSSLYVDNDKFLEHTYSEISVLDSLIEHSAYERAQVLADSLNSLFENKKQYTELRLQVRFRQATILDEQDDIVQALSILLEILDQSKGFPEISYQANLTTALVYEKAGNLDFTDKYLEEAYKLYKEHKLEELYSTYCLRRGSYYRLLKQPDSTFYYAETAIRYAEKYWNEKDFFDAFLLIEWYFFSRKNYQKLIEYQNLNLEYSKKRNNPSMLASSYNNIANIFTLVDDYKKALAYNDSAYLYYDSVVIQYRVLLSRRRSEIFDKLGYVDSAYHCFKQYHEDKMLLVAEEESLRTKEIEERYQNDKKEAVIENRSKLLVLASGVAVLVAALAGLLFRQNRRIRSQKALIDDQVGDLQELLQHNRKLDESKSLFYANASHELRTPLTLMLGPLETVLKNKDLSQPRKNQLLSIAAQGGASLKNLITQILDLGKLDGGNMNLHLKPTSIHDFFETWLIQFESLAQNKGIEYRVENPIEKDFVGLLDQEKSRQIINNLVSNALKFTLAGGSIVAKVDYEYGLLRFSVSDTGRGIDTSDLPYVFDRYFQASNRDELAEGGMGIGLALCRDYATLMKGAIHVESTVGVGSNFVIEFPVEKAVGVLEEELSFVEAVEELEQPEQVPTAGKSTILVVEDNPTLQNYLHLLLSGTYNVLLANHGEEALGLLHKDKNIDLVISDLMMPVMDGYQLLNGLKTNEQFSGVPVIMLTARAEKDAKLKALKIGVDDYVTKPFNEEELKARIGNLLRNYNIRKQALEEDYKDQVIETFSEDDKWLEGFEKYIKTIYLNNQISIPDIANHQAMSESGLLRRLKRLTGLSPMQYVQELRLQEAFALLSEGHNSVQQVALKVGYNDPRNFSRAFKNRFGKLPSAITLA